MDHVVQVGPEEDPYFEEIPENELHFYQRKGARRKRRLPDFIDSKDLKILESVKRKAYRLDLQLSICGFRLGWAGIIGLIPGIGDLIAVAFALQLIKKAEQIDGGLPASIRLKMMMNVAFDFGIGLIPIVGDFCNIAFKCNSRNFILLEKYLMEKYSKKLGIKIKLGEAQNLAERELKQTYEKETNTKRNKPDLPPRSENEGQVV